MKKVIMSIGAIVFLIVLTVNVSLGINLSDDQDFSLSDLITKAYAQNENDYSAFEDLGSITVADLMNLTDAELEHLNNSLDTYAEIQFQAARPSGEWFSVGVPTIVNVNNEGMEASGSNSQNVSANLVGSKLASLSAAQEANFRYNSGTTSTYKTWDCIGYSGDC
ncbi:hypothetical protein [Algibacter pacificus]|uniref:hypothetical protein n=1 Tax=Algibacter pacificus TaxID=2599389 RepID=UPI0011CCDD20|nr:hypothetical protein [Algibacter pacificus]